MYREVSKCLPHLYRRDICLRLPAGEVAVPNCIRLFWWIVFRVRKPVNEISHCPTPFFLFYPGQHVIRLSQLTPCKRLLFADSLPRPQATIRALSSQLIHAADTEYKLTLSNRTQIDGWLSQPRPWIYALLCRTNNFATNIMLKSDHVLPNWGNVWRTPYKPRWWCSCPLHLFRSNSRGNPSIFWIIRSRILGNCVKTKLLLSRRLKGSWQGQWWRWRRHLRRRSLRSSRDLMSI